MFFPTKLSVFIFFALTRLCFLVGSRRGEGAVSVCGRFIRFQRREEVQNNLLGILLFLWVFVVQKNCR